MEFRLLGPLEVTHEGAPVPIDGRDRRLVLALLLAHANEIVPADSLVAHLATEDSSSEARPKLQSEVAALQEALNVETEVLAPKAPGYRLEVAGRQVDALLFEDLVSRADDALADDPAEARELLGEALGLWRGVPFADLAGEPGLRPFVSQLDARRRRAVERRIDAELALGNHEELVPELEALTREHPLEEEFWSQLMLALYRSGRAAEALTAYEKAERVLAEELATEPSEELKSLQGRIADRDETLDISREVVVEEVTLLFTDLEGSASLWEKHPEEMGEAIARHDRLISGVVTDYGGAVFKGTGDGVLAVMPSTSSAVQAAIATQRALIAEEWGTVGELKVRMAIHEGDAEHRGDDYFGPTLNRAARLMACGHGGQVLLSAAAQSRLDQADGFELLELGEHRLRSLGEPEVIFQLVAEGLPTEFPPLQVDSAPVHLQAAGFARTVRGYELREQIGEGDFGLVYRAYQASVGREVALKAIRPEYANDPDFVRSFENEGRLVAQLEHPHIVSLYDFWREPDNAYLVMRWMRGGSLRDSLRQGPWRLESGVRLIDQIGAALSYAHRHGVLHRDIKPTNVLLDQDGNGYLSDFGLATRLRDPQDTSRVWTSSPAYLPPEAELGEPPSARSDIYSFGLLVGEVVTGEPPTSEAAGPLVQLPDALVAVLSKATEVRPEERFESVDEFVAAVREAVQKPAERVAERAIPVGPLGEVRNPYKGLRPFFETDAEDFFGRESLVSQLLDKIETSRLVGVVGASGSGKSSVVRAGLVPALREGRFDGSDSWFIADCFPGAYPFEELEAALLRVAVRDPAAIDQLSEDPRGLLRVSKQILPDDGSELLLVIDQFEELFTLVDDEDIRQRFLEVLATAVTDPRSRVRVIVTLRADFFDRPLQYSPFGELLRDGLVPITPLNETELTEAVSGPARGVGLEIEPTLLTQVVADVRQQPGVLPLLQYSLTEVFERRDDGRLTLEAYEASGGVLGALGRRAEEIYAKLDPAGQEACQQLFLRLVTVGQADDTRRRITRAELRDLSVDQRALDQVVDEFGSYRLLAFDRDPVSRAPTAEVAHEALLREWQRLRGWIESRREDLLQHRRLASATRDWLEGDREPSYLLRGGRLEQMEEWAAETDLSLTTSERALLEESRNAEATRARKRRRRRGAVVGGLAIAAAVSLVIAIFAFAQRGEAEARAREAAARELAAASLANLDTDPELSLLLALEATAAFDDEGTVIREAEEALHAAVLASRLEATLPNSGIGVFSPDGSMFVAGDPVSPRVIDGRGRTRFVSDAANGKATIWATDSWELVSECCEHLLGTAVGAGGFRGIQNVAFSPDGRLAATAGGNDKVQVWDVATGQQLLKLDIFGPIALAFSPDGELIAASGSGFFGGQVLVWDATTGEQVARLRLDAAGIDFSPDMPLFAVAEFDRAAILYDVNTWEEFVRNEHGAPVCDVAFDPTSERLISGANDGTAVIWGIAGALVALQGHSGPLCGVDFSPDGTRVATASDDGTARVWDAATGALLIQVSAGRGINNVTFSPDGTRLATAQRDGTAKIWNISDQGGGEVLAFSAPGSVGGVSFGGPDILASRSEHGIVQVRRISTGETVFDIQGGLGPGRVAFSPDGSLIGAPGPQNGALIFDAASGDSVLRLEGHVSEVLSVSFSHDGRWITTSSADGSVRLYNRATGEERLGAAVFTAFGPRPPLVAHRSFFPVFTATFNSDDDLILSASADGFARFSEVSTGRATRGTYDHNTNVLAAALSPDEKHMAAAGQDGTVSLWTLETGGKRVLRVAGVAVNDVEYSPDGSQLATGSADGVVTLWSVETGEELLAISPHRGAVADLEFSSDGRYLATGGADGVTHVLVLEVSELIELAESRVTRALTDAECQRYLHVEACPEV